MDSPDGVEDEAVDGEDTSSGISDRLRRFKVGFAALRALGEG